MAKNHLPARPRPAHRPEDPESAARQRHLDCRGYDACLELAARRGWRSFHCRACPAYEPSDPATRRREMHGLLELLAECEVGAAALAEGTPPPPARLFLPDLDDTGAPPVN